MQYEHVGQGTTIPIGITLEGLGGAHLTDSGVALTAVFFAKPVSKDAVPKKVTINKADMVSPTEGDSDTLLCLVNTTQLDCGILMAHLNVSYASTTYDENVVEKMEVETSVIIKKSYA